MTEEPPKERTEYDKNGTPTPTERLAFARALVADMPFALVPTEPTTAMIVAAIERPDISDNGNGLFYAGIYCAMIAAAPETADDADA